MLSKLFNRPKTLAVAGAYPQIGNLARCKVTGLTGTIDLKTEALTGTVQFSIQPEGDGTSRPDGYCMDWQVIEVLGEGVAGVMPKPDNATIPLGAQVEDEASGFKGIATSRVTYLNGCVSYGVQPKVDKDGALPELVYLDWKRLKVIGVGVKPHTKATKPVVERTGGPTTRTASIRRA